MSEALKGGEEFLKKHWPWIAAGAGVLLLYSYATSSGSSSSPATSVSGTNFTGADLASIYSAQIAAQQQQEQSALAAQQLQDQYNLSLSALAANNSANLITASGTVAANYLTAEGTTAQNIATGYAGIVSAEAALPASAIAYSNQTAQASLLGSAQIAASGLQAEGLAVQGFGNAVGGIGQATQSTITSVNAANAAQNQAAVQGIGNIIGLGTLALGASNLLGFGSSNGDFGGGSAA